MVGKHPIEDGLSVAPAEIADPATNLAAVVKRTASGLAPAVA